MKTQIMKVTPELAARWLSLNTNNRPVSHNRVELYTRDMQQGNWKLTHQGVAISVDNVIGDGQHRLLAVVRSGVTVEMLVTTGLPTESIIAVDRGYSRSISDSIVLSMKGSDWITPQITSAVKWAYLRRATDSASDVYKGCEAIKDSLLFMADQMKSKITGITRAPVFGAVTLMHAYGEDQATLATFCKKLTTGVTEGEAETSIVRLREWLLVNSGSGSAIQLEALAKTQRAFQLFEAKTPCKHLRTPETLPFPRLNHIKGE